MYSSQMQYTLTSESSQCATTTAMVWNDMVWLLPNSYLEIRCIIKQYSHDFLLLESSAKHDRHDAILRREGMLNGQQ